MALHLLRRATGCVLSLLLVVVVCAGASCPGCPEPVAALSSDHERLVDWAVLQLSGATGCQRSRTEVKNFVSQVVAGELFKFDLVLEHSPDAIGGCKSEPGATEECHMVVWEKSWADFREVQWDQTTCSKEGNSSPLRTANGCVLNPDTENVVSSVLPGNWTMDWTMTGWLSHEYWDAESGLGGGYAYTFQDIPEVLEQISADDCGWLEDRNENRIYMAGHITGGRSPLPFVLTTDDSRNPVVVFWATAGPGGGLVMQSWSVMVVKAEDSLHDILFIRSGPFPASDESRDPISAYARAERLDEYGNLE